MSDSNDNQSIQLGNRLLQELGVVAGQAGPSDPGAALEESIVDALQAARPDLSISRSRPATDFAQYSHLKVFPSFHKGHRGSEAALASLLDAIENLPEGTDNDRLKSVAAEASAVLESDAALIDTLKHEMPQESLLKIDVSVGVPGEDDIEELAVALSCKWSLRTDRAQDCVSQGSKLVAQRRGRMPHFAVVTIETRPAMLKILADGSGAVDYVYHLDLPALVRTIHEESKLRKNPQSWSPLLTFNRIVRQGRLRDFDDLVRHVKRLPVGWDPA